MYCRQYPGTVFSIVGQISHIISPLPCHIPQHTRNIFYWLYNILFYLFFIVAIRYSNLLYWTVTGTVRIILIGYLISDLISYLISHFLYVFLFLLRYEMFRTRVNYAYVGTLHSVTRWPGCCGCHTIIRTVALVLKHNYIINNAYKPLINTYNSYVTSYCWCKSY